MKYLLCVLLSLVISLALSACGSEERTLSFSSNAVPLESAPESLESAPESTVVSVPSSLPESSAPSNLTEKVVIPVAPIESEISEQPSNSQTVSKNESKGGEEPVSSKAQKEEIDSAVIDITLTIGNDSFSAKLNNNATTRALTKRFPLTLVMGDLHGNEKFNYLAEELPTNSEPAGQISTGDIMLYGSDCLVLFYDSFSTVFSYTKLGSVNEAENFAAAVGSGNITITFTK